ncbi:MAG: sugar transferase, partial [Verrucomicrobiota bacterium]
EIPQLWNVLRGEMSFVGPRPCLPSQSELIEEREKRGVFTVLPGVTGLGQINGIDMSVPERLAECDAEYVQNQNLALDLRIIWQTVMGAGREDRVRSA